MMADWADALTAGHPLIAAATYFGIAGEVSLLPASRMRTSVS